MAYCTITNVQGHNPKRTYSESSTPTTTQVQVFIDRISDEIDVILGSRGLTTPVTTPTTLANFLIQVNAYGAAALAEQAMFPENKGMMQGTSQAATLWKQYQEALKYLKDGALPTGSDSAMALPFSFWGKHAGEDTEPEENYDWQKSKFGKNKEF